MSDPSPVIPERKSGKKNWLYAIIALYLITWIWGVPATHAAIAKDICRKYGESVMASDGKIMEDDFYPNIWFEFSLPIAPFVVINQYGYVFAGLEGKGCFTIDIWLVVGTKRLYEKMLWIA